MNDNITILQWSVTDLWNGCMLASIAHAIMVSHYPELSNEHSWDEISYSAQDSQGTRGTITFTSNNHCTGAFRDEKSDRICGNNYMKYYHTAPEQIKKLAENETLQYLLENSNGQVVPVITTAFWGIDNMIFSTDSEENMKKNGLNLMDRQIMPFQKAINSWVEYYDMSIGQKELLTILYEIKVLNNEANIIINENEIKLIECDDLSALEYSKEAFLEIGIIFI